MPWSDIEVTVESREYLLFPRKIFIISQGKAYLSFKMHTK
jgi:hypothetical protein